MNFTIFFSLSIFLMMAFSQSPDVNLNFTQIIQRHGYPVETHEVTTSDGYILTMFRIPYERNSTKPGGKPVLVK